MIKIGLIGDGIDRYLFQKYPLEINLLLLVDENGNPKAQFHKEQLLEWINQEVDSDADSLATMNTKVISILLQGLNTYDDVQLYVAQIPTYPPESSMAALATGLQWMSEEIQPDFIHIGFSTQEGKYQKVQTEWLNKLHKQGCKVISPAGIPPAFPASLDHVLSVADRGFINAGFAASNPDIIIEEQQVVSYENGEWAKQDLLNETASALALSRMIRDHLSDSDNNTGSKIVLPDFNQLSTPQTEKPESAQESFDITKPSFGHKVGNYFKSRLSRIIVPTGKVPKSIKETRKVSCNGDDAAIGPCQFRVESKKQVGAFICGACGCGDGKDVLVKGEVPDYEKLDYPYVQCPASMPGFSNYLPSKDESNPDERKLTIEQKYGEARLQEQTEVQMQIDKKLKKRLSWLDRIFKVS